MLRLADDPTLQRLAGHPLRGKVRHVSADTAWARVRSFERRGRPEVRPGPLRPYWCQSCEAWHVGHGREVGRDG